MAQGVHVRMEYQNLMTRASISWLYRYGISPRQHSYSLYCSCNVGKTHIKSGGTCGLTRWSTCITVAPPCGLLVYSHCLVYYAVASVSSSNLHSDRCSTATCYSTARASKRDVNRKVVRESKSTESVTQSRKSRDRSRYGVLPALKKLKCQR